MFVRVLDTLVKRILDSKYIWDAPLGMQDGNEKVISISDLLEVVQKLDDEEKQRILALFKQNEAHNVATSSNK